MPKPQPLSIHWTAPLASQFEQTRDHLARRGIRLSKTQLGEIAIRRFLDSLKDNPEQWDLDFRDS